MTSGPRDQWARFDEMGRDSARVPGDVCPRRYTIKIAAGQLAPACCLFVSRQYRVMDATGDGGHTKIGLWTR